MDALPLWVWSTEEMQREPWMRKTKESPKCQVQESRCWARIRWEAEAGLLRMSKMGPQVQEAMQGRVPEIQGQQGKSIMEVATEWHLESITLCGEGQQEAGPRS